MVKLSDIRKIRRIAEGWRVTRVPVMTAAMLSTRNGAPVKLPGRTAPARTR